MRVFIAGPYTNGDVALNVQTAIMAASKVFDAGHHPFLPHLFHFWHLVLPRPYEDWTALDLAWLQFCDALVRLPGPSNGADQEVICAEALGIPVYYDVDAFLSAARLAGQR